MSELEVSIEQLNINKSDQTPIFDGLNGDLTLKIGDGCLKVHKCILKSCPYFAAMIDGQWIENHNSTINIHGYSVVTVKFAVQHIYQPQMSIPPDVNLVELVTFYDMIGLNSLHELLIKTISEKLCHNFHKPCSNCIVGVIECLQLADRYNLPEIRTKCLQWICKHFVKTWNSRSFANISETLRKECLTCVQQSMKVDTIISLVMECQRLEHTLPTVKWAQEVAPLVKELLTSCIEYIQTHFCNILNSPKFWTLKSGNFWDISRIESILQEAIKNLPEDQCCMSYNILIKKKNLLCDPQNLNQDQDADYIAFVKKLENHVKNRLVQRVAMATVCSSWSVLPKEVQNEIMQLGLFNPVDRKPSSRPSSANSSRTTPRVRSAVSRPSTVRNPTPNNQMQRR